jgi:hypothetical protein
MCQHTSAIIPRPLAASGEAYGFAGGGVVEVQNLAAAVNRGGDGAGFPRIAGALPHQPGKLDLLEGRGICGDGVQDVGGLGGGVCVLFCGQTIPQAGRGRLHHPFDTGLLALKPRQFSGLFSLPPLPLGGFPVEDHGNDCFHEFTHGRIARREAALGPGPEPT